MDGNTLEHIDTSRPLEVAGCEFSEITDPDMRALAEKLGDPNLLNVMSPAGAVSVQGRDAVDLIEMIKRPRHRSLFEGDLQCLSETRDGEPLLTTFFFIEQFEALLAEAPGRFAEVRAAVVVWRSAGLRQASLEGFAIPGYEEAGASNK